MARAFFVVGHEQWGKSRTLGALVGSQARSVEIGGTSFFVRRMSNDDYPDRFQAFVEGLDPASRPHAIVALCPKFDDGDFPVASLLVGLRERYDLFFFVLLHKYGARDEITAAEIARLREYGVAHIFDRRDAEAPERAEALRRFIVANA